MGSNKERLWYAQSQEEVLEQLQTSNKGLSESEAEKRLIEYGKNELRQMKAKSIWRMLVEQLTDPMILVLLAACILSFVMNEIVEGSVIIFIVVANQDIREGEVITFEKVMYKKSSDSRGYKPAEFEKELPLISKKNLKVNQCITPQDVDQLKVFNEAHQILNKIEMERLIDLLRLNKLKK